MFLTIITSYIILASGTHSLFTYLNLMKGLNIKKLNILGQGKHYFWGIKKNSKRLNF